MSKLEVFDFALAFLKCNTLGQHMGWVESLFPGPPQT